MNRAFGNDKYSARLSEKGVIVAARNRKTGIMMVAGVFLFVSALGANALYSIQNACLVSLPPKCYTGYDALSEVQKLFLSPGLYIISACFFFRGAVFWFKNDSMLETSSA